MKHGGKDKHDTKTGDLLSWEPKPPVKIYSEEQVRAATLQTRICHAITLAIKESPLGRKDIAAKMSKFLGEEVPKNMLDAYTSEARTDHNISHARLIALAAATGDMRLLSIGPEMFDHAVIEKRYLGAVKEAMCEAAIEDLKQQKSQARKTWKGWS